MHSWRRRWSAISCSCRRSWSDLWAECSHAIAPRSLQRPRTSAHRSRCTWPEPAKTNNGWIVEWIVPDTRQYISEHDRNRDPEKHRDSARDAVRFRSPLDFPVTTAPTMIVAKGRFNGRQMSYWVNPGEETHCTSPSAEHPYAERRAGSRRRARNRLARR